MNLRPDLALFDDPAVSVQWLTQWVNNRVIPISDQEWIEVQVEFGDANSYVTALLARPSDVQGYQLTIELGVRWETEHRATACMVFEWDRENHAIGQIRSVLLDGQTSELRLFVRRMLDFEKLPRVTIDVGA